MEQREWTRAIRVNKIEERKREREREREWKREFHQEIYTPRD